MAPSVKLHFFAANDVNGSLLHEITDEDDYFKSLKLKVERDGLGGAELLLARTVGFSPFADGTFRAESFVRLIIPAYSSTTYYPWGFFLNKRQQVVVHVDEKGGEEFKLGGPGPKQYLARHALGISQATGTGANLDLENGIWRWNENATVGRILDRILQEDAALNNPSLPDLTYTFDNIDDSDGVNWIDDDIAGPGEFEIPIGTDLLKILWDLDNFVELTSWIDLGTVASPKFELNIIQGIGDDNTGSAVGAGVCLLKEGVNVADDAVTVEGASLRQASHVLVEGKDGVWVQAVRTGYSPGDYTKREKISFTRTSNEAWLEAVGKRWLDRQDNGEKEVTVEIVPGQSDNTGLYFPAPNRVLWLSNLISVETAADGTSQTALDLDPSDPQLVTGFELETHQAADDLDSTALARSWDVKVKLNIERSGNVEKTPDQRSSIRTEYVNKLQLCVSLDCDDIDAATSPAVTVTNGNAENAAGGQWSGGAYTTAKFHAGARSYQDAAVTTGDLLYTFSGVTFLAGTRYVFDFWRRLTIDHDRTEITVGDTVAGDTESRSFIGAAGSDPPDIWNETAVGADGGTWNRGRICWTPSANTTAVTFRFVSTSFSAGDHAIDDLSCVTAAAADELAGNDPRAARCDHGHLVESLPTTETDTSLRLAPDGSGGVEFVAGGGGGAPTTADYLVGTAQAGLSAEIVVGTTPGGELGGTWAAPTVDATHSGSAHHAESHNTRHQSGGADAVKLDDLAAPDDNTDLNASTSAHGLLRKLDNVATNFLDGTGNWAIPLGSGSSLFARKTSDQTATTTSFVDVTGLTFSVSANLNYRFRFVVFLLTSGTSEGYSLSVNGPSGTYKIGGILPLQVPAGTGNAALHGSGAVADTTGLTVTSGPGGSAVMALVEGVVLVGASGGTLALRVKTESGGANTTTIQANSYGELTQL